MVADGGRRKDGRPWCSRREVTEASPAPYILPPVNLPPLFFCLLPAVAAAAAPEPLLPLARSNTMAEPGHSLHPSASTHPNLSALCWGLQGGQKEDPANECVCERGAPGAGGGAPEPH